MVKGCNLILIGHQPLELKWSNSYSLLTASIDLTSDHQPCWAHHLTAHVYTLKYNLEIFSNDFPPLHPSPGQQTVDADRESLVRPDLMTTPRLPSQSGAVQGHMEGLLRQPKQHKQS